MKMLMFVVFLLVFAGIAFNSPVAAQAPDVGGGRCVANCGGGPANNVNNYNPGAAAAAEAERQRIEADRLRREAERKRQKDELRRQEQERQRREAEERHRNQEEFERNKAQALRDLKGASSDNFGLKGVDDTGIGLKDGLKDAEKPPAASTNTPPPQAHPRIGAAAAVQGTVYWLTSDGRKIPITSSSPIILGARIVTGDNSRLQVLLLDETVFTIGANSDLVLDEFVYDPSTSAGKITARVSKGIFRFVTGKVAHKDPAKMKVTLPVGDLGFRGTDVEARVAPDGSGSVTLYYGQLEITEKKTGFTFLMNAGEKVTFTSEGTFSRPIKFRSPPPR